MCVPVFVCASDWEGECESEREGREIRALLIENANLIETQVTEKRRKVFFLPSKQKKTISSFWSKVFEGRAFFILINFVRNAEMN